MSERNKTFVRRAFEEVWNKKNLVSVGYFFAFNYVNQDPNAPDSRDYQGLRQVATVQTTAFPDLKITIDDLVAEEDRVASRWTMTGTNTGEFMGMPATGKPMTMTGLTLFRVSQVGITEGVWSYDALGMMRQLGLIPGAG